MEVRRSMASRFKQGYLPFTTGALLFLVCWPYVVNSGSSLPGAGFALVLWAVSVVLAQLSLLLVPYPDPTDFRAMCFLLTVGSLVLGPFGVILLAAAATYLALRAA